MAKASWFNVPMSGKRDGVLTISGVLTQDV